MKLFVDSSIIAEPTSSFHDVLSFNAGLNKYLAEFKKGYVAKRIWSIVLFLPFLLLFFCRWVGVSFKLCLCLWISFDSSLVHVQADVRMQPQEQTDPQHYQPAVVRLTLR
jgi:hypothetical protein